MTNNIIQIFTLGEVNKGLYSLDESCIHRGFRVCEYVLSLENITLYSPQQQSIFAYYYIFKDIYNYIDYKYI